MRVFYCTAVLCPLCVSPCLCGEKCRVLLGAVFSGAGNIAFSMFDGLVTGIMADAVRSAAAEEDVAELRMRVGRSLVVRTAGERIVARMPTGYPYIVTADDVERLLAAASDYSVYAVSDNLVKGYLSKRGVRIGVAGEGVTDGGSVLNMKHIRFVTVRIPRQIKGVADGVKGRIFGGDGVKNTLVVSPPSGGKTTLLRELARLASERWETLVIDERGEIAAAADGVPTFDVGDCDVVTGVPKQLAYENTIRAMNPEVIVTDELFGERDAEAVCDIVRSGVKVFASVHGKGAENVFRSRALRRVTEIAELYVVLSARPRAGTLVEVLTAEQAEARYGG